MASIVGGPGYGGSVWNNPAYQKTASASGTSGASGTGDVSGTSGASGAGDISGVGDVSNTSGTANTSNAGGPFGTSDTDTNNQDYINAERGALRELFSSDENGLIGQPFTVNGNTYEVYGFKNGNTIKNVNVRQIYR